MSNKKTIKRNKRNSKRGKSRKGGFFGLFKDNHNSECDPNNLDNLETSNELHSEYQKCCPKSWYGRKNNSQYCKDIDLKYKDAFNTRSKDANLSKKLMTQRFTTDYNRSLDNNSSLDDDASLYDGSLYVIDCEDPELYNDEESIAEYKTTCGCPDKISWWDFSKKSKNCRAVDKKLKEIKKSGIQQGKYNIVPSEEDNIEQRKRSVEKMIEENKKSKESLDKMIEDEKRQERRKYDNIIEKYPPEIYGYTEYQLINDLDRVKKIILNKDTFFKKIMKEYPPELYDNYTRQQLNRYPDKIIQNNRSKQKFVEKFMIKYNPKEYGYTYDELMMDTKRVMREVKEKEVEFEDKRYQESLNPYDIEKGADVKEIYSNFKDPLDLEFENPDQETQEEEDMSRRSPDGGSKTRKHLKKHSIRKRKQKRIKTRKQ